MIRDKWVVDKEYKAQCVAALGKNLVPLRAKAAVTQEEIASIVGVSRQTYYAVETGKRTMSWNTYLSLILFFDTNADTHELLREVNAYPERLMRCMSGRN